MARKGREDRGLRWRTNTAGKVVWYARIGIGGGAEMERGPFPTKTKAREFYQKCKTEQAEERFNPDHYRRIQYDQVSVMIERYMATNKLRSRREDSRHATWWRAQLGNTRLNQVTPALLEEAMRKLARTEDGRNKKQDGPKTTYTPQTVVHYMKFLRKVLNVAVRDGRLGRNPFGQVKLPKVSTGKTRFLTLEEEARLMNALGPYASWANLAILTGLRREEQFSLPWFNVNLERGLITLPATKAGDVQYVHLSQDAKAILHGMDAKAAVAEAEAIANGKKRKRSEWVFPSKNPDTHIDPANFYRRVYLPAVKAAGLEGVTWHTLRHTFASRLAMSNQTESTIATLLRHSGTTLVRRYAHLSPSHLQGAVERVATFGLTESQPETPSEAQKLADSERNRDRGGKPRGRERRKSLKTCGAPGRN